MPDTATTLPFAGGEFRFWLPMPQIVAIERGPLANRHEGYPRSVFAMYDAISAGLGISDDGGAVYVGGAEALVGDVRNIILQGLIGGASGTIDGDEIKVTPAVAADLVKQYTYPYASLTEAMHLAYLILNPAIRGVQLKKKPVAAEESEQTNLSAKGE